MNIDHIGIWVSDLEKEREFFTNYFECTVNYKYVNPDKHFSSYFLSFPEGARIEIMHRTGMSGNPGNEVTGISHLAVNAGSRINVDKLTERIGRDGFVVAGKPRVTGDGYYESVILDPEGNRIEILSY